jgi:hypothetical protein
MIRDRHESAFDWNVLEVGGLGFEPYLHFGEQGFRSKIWRRGAYALIQFANLIHGNQFPGESGQASKKWRPGQ